MPKSAKVTAAAIVKKPSKAATASDDVASASFTQEECIEVSSPSTECQGPHDTSRDGPLSVIWHFIRRLC